MHTCMHGDRFSKIYQKVSSGWLRVVRLWGNYYIILYWLNIFVINRFVSGGEGESIFIKKKKSTIVNLKQK